MIFDAQAELRPLSEQYRIDDAQYRRQLEYLFAHSAFYRDKLAAAGIPDARGAGGLDNIHALPFTHKDELRGTQAEVPPFGAHLACAPDRLARVYSTSGTTGVPCFIGFTAGDLDMLATNVARGYCAAGFRAGQRIVVSANAGPFVAGAAYLGFDRIGCVTIPVGTGNTERLVGAIRNLGATGISCTPSFGLYLIDWCAARGVETRALGIRNMITAGEPGGGDAAIRARIEHAFGCVVREAMGIGDISLTVWAEDEAGDGMSFMARDHVHVELIDPDSGTPLPWEHGVRGELVYTALRREAMPLLRFRSRDHVVVNMQTNPTGRTGPRVRCIGRTDDLLIVRGVNLFPTALREVFTAFRPFLGERYVIRPTRRGVSQSPPLPVTVELGVDVRDPPSGLRERIESSIRERLQVRTSIELVAYGTLPRGEYKVPLVDYTAVRD